VASAAPTRDDLDRLPNTDLRDALLHIKEETKDRVRQTLEKHEILPADVFHEIPELPELKWRETIRVFAPDETPYETLAGKLL
jgi:hypothetical protein